MKDLHNLLIERHSIRRYTEQPLSPEQVKLILEAALLAPSSKSSRPWQFVAVEDKEMLARLSECRPMGSAPIGRCVLAIAVCADPAVTDTWIEDATIAASYMQLQAADLGLGSCWIQVRGRFAPDDTPTDEYVQKLLGIPENQRVLCIVTFGYKDEVRRPVDTSKLLWEKVHVGTWKSVE